MTVRYQKEELQADILTPIAIFNRIQGEKKFILESSSHHEDKGRYSFIGVNPYQELIGTDRMVTIKKNRENEVIKGNPLEVIKEQIPQIDLGLPFPFYGGAIGYIGYDLIHHYHQIGELLDDEIDMPDLHLMIYQDVLIFDHQKQSLTIIALDLSGSRDDQKLQKAIDDFKKQLQVSQAEITDANLTLKFKPGMEQQRFMSLVQKAKDYIDEGKALQVVLSQRMQAKFSDNPFYLYRRLRVLNRSPYMYYIDFSEYQLVGASPESLLKVKGRQIVTNPIAGTKPRGETTADDQRLAEELLKDPKEVSEHKMLIDLSRTDLERVCQPETIKISKHMLIERYQHVMHIISELTGDLKSGLSSIDALISLLPAGTVSGAPKQTAMTIINELEQVRRGVYAGAVGYININGDLDLAIAIRTMVIKNKIAYVQAGAGIVAESDPESEYQETLNKAKSLIEVADNK